MNMMCYNTTGLKNAVDLWCSDRTRAAGLHGTIDTWHTCNATSLRDLFADRENFNEELSAWDTARVTSMYFAFHDASSFNRDIAGWDTASVRSMAGMFGGASSFNVDLSAWDVGRVEETWGMFGRASSFRQCLRWHLRADTDTESMFSNCGGRVSKYCRPTEAPTPSPEVPSSTRAPPTAAPSRSRNSYSLPARLQEADDSKTMKATLFLIVVCGCFTFYQMKAHPRGFYARKVQNMITFTTRLFLRKTFPFSTTAKNTE